MRVLLCVCLLLTACGASAPDPVRRLDGVWDDPLTAGHWTIDTEAGRLYLGDSPIWQSITVTAESADVIAVTIGQGEPFPVRFVNDDLLQWDATQGTEGLWSRVR